MTSTANPRTAAEALVDQLVAEGVRDVFCVPGESYLAVLDAFHDRDLAVTVCRQEGGAAMMAEAVGKITGRPGICFVTRGPGATNAAPGIHIAQQDSSPLILFVGQVGRGMRERDAFQEVDYRAMYGGMAKWVAEIGEAERVPEYVSRAFRVATGGRPGPVVLALPQDLLTERIGAGTVPPLPPVETTPSAADISALAAMLAGAHRPIAILGGSRWSAAACAAFGAFAEKFALPVATSYRRAHLFDALHPCCAGDLGIAPNPALVARIADADLVLLVGGRLSETPSQGYTLLDVPVPRQALVHVHPDDEELGKVYRPRLAIHATPHAFSLALAALDPPDDPARREETAAAHAAYLAFGETPTPVPGALDLGEIVVWLRDHLPADAIVTNGAGNYATWIHRFYRFRRFGTQAAPVSGSMGYGVPAAVALKKLYPDRTVVAFSGDGDFLMNGQEFATAVQYGLPIVVVVCDNGIYGTIRMHQERAYPGRVSATTLRNPDFAALARAFGGFGATVARTAEFPAAFAEARASGLPSILHLKIDPEAITPTTTLAKIRETALAARRPGAMPPEHGR
ncbi:Thiamine pyrophosphate-requiring protein [Rhodovulum sp. PH10]|uniref:thiamine pyrophosphate-binding protein n=1 Tax=Rhodovulum sp. PH10 TaxID=1187851 RepID=UPI00027C1FA3|nr:thiamine pyrophosphate-binding protein [Rhodovulum sp. PH10]EJW13265.1 Thiamine pyrophosphate-requiring protein [Rhodovulum sp. PH10]